MFSAKTGKYARSPNCWANRKESMLFQFSAKLKECISNLVLTFCQLGDDTPLQSISGSQMLRIAKLPTKLDSLAYLRTVT